MATESGNPGQREVVVVGWDGRSNPMRRYADEMHLPDSMRQVVPPPPPTTVDRKRLERRAREATDWRGHDLHPWVVDSPLQSHTACRRCGRGVHVTALPAPNEIDIAGEAVAVHCTESASA